ncbi:MAG: hypothetical protein HAW67_06155 [Endozoicomonadaceae bacterium]|nr:hypothetical protein [Endozoicomonadaceae bacterium]
MLKNSVLLFLCICLSFNAFAGLKTKLFFAGGALAVHAALKSPTLRKKIIEKTIANPALKDKAKNILVNFMKNPKNAKYKDKAKDFYRQIIGVPSKVKGRFPINSYYAGKTFHLAGKLKSKYPHGVPFTTRGFPDFSRYVFKKTKIKFTGNRNIDFKKASDKVGITEKWRKKNKYTWHHKEDGTTMQLLKFDLHDAVKHTGGIAIKGGR